MPARIHKLPESGEIIDDLKVIEIYRDKNKKVRVKGCCTICGKERVKGKGLCSANFRFHTIWQAMRSRIDSPNNTNYQYYGGRGIKADEFILFVDFYDKMHESYLEAVKKYGNESSVSLDRINPNKDYSVENCKWISLDEQKKNKRNSRWFKAVSPQGEKFIACNKVKFAEKHNLKRVTINSALLYGYKNREDWKFRYLTVEEIENMNLIDRLSSEECND